MHHPTTVKNYTCKYIECTRPVYAIVKYRDNVNTERKIANASFHTVPFRSNAKCDTFNCMTTFICPSHAKIALDEIKTKMSKSDDVYEIEKYSLMDISYYAFMMHLPLITFLASHCDLEDKSVHYDIFYTARILDHPQDYARPSL
jgi:hypothetical protein